MPIRLFVVLLPMVSRKLKGLRDWSKRKGMELEKQEKMRAGTAPEGLPLLLEEMAVGGEEHNKNEITRKSMLVNYREMLKTSVLSFICTCWCLKLKRLTCKSPLHFIKCNFL